MSGRGFYVRAYVILLLLSLAVDVKLFSLAALTIQTVPLCLFVLFAGAPLPLLYFEDFRRFAGERKRLLAITALFLVSGVLSAFLSPFSVLYGLKWLAQYGIFMAMSFFLLFLFSLERGLGLFFLRILAVLAVLLAILSFFEAVDKDLYRFLSGAFRDGEMQVIDGRYRVGATLTNPNIFGCFMSLGIFLLWFQKESFGMKTTFFYVAAAFLCAALALSGSRNGTLVLFVPLGFLLFNRKTAKTALVVLFCAALALVLLTPFLRFADLGEQPLTGTVAAPAGLAYNKVTSRVMIWKSALAMFRDHPLFGIGPGGVNEALRDYAPADLLAMDSGKIEKGYLNAHNGFLNILAEFGAAGTALALLFVFCLFMPLARRYGFFPFGPVQALLLGLVLSFGPDAFFYSRFYMVMTVTVFLIFAFPGEALGDPAAAQAEDPET